MVVYILELEWTPPLQFSPQWTCSHSVCNGVVYLIHNTGNILSLKYSFATHEKTLNVGVNFLAMNKTLDLLCVGVWYKHK